MWIAKGIGGITLVALVVTIVILIILATVSVSALFGENGLIKKAQEAKQHQTNVDNATKKISHDIYGKTRQAPIHLKLDDFSVFINDKNITIILQNEKTIENVK